MSGALNTMRNRNEILVLMTCVSGFTQLKNVFSLCYLAYLSCLSCFLDRIIIKKAVNTGALTSCVSEVAIELNSIVMNSQYSIML